MCVCACVRVCVRVCVCATFAGAYVDVCLCTRMCACMGVHVSILYGILSMVCCPGDYVLLTHF